MAKRLTKEEIQFKLKDKGFELIGEYTISSKATLVKCYCGVTFKPILKDVIRGHTKSCGCLQGRNKDYTGLRFGRLKVVEKDAQRNDNKTYWKCLCDCGKEKIVSCSGLNGEYVRSCGCLHKEVSTNRLKEIHQNQKGKNHPRYDVNLTDEERISRRLIKENKDWTNTIFQKDNYTCAICSKTNCELNAHHMDAYHWCKERRFDVSNGVALCVKCHKDFHSKYGQKNNTESQFKEYMSLHSH